jgi:hypothetical protein
MKFPKLPKLTAEEKRDLIMTAISSVVMSLTAQLTDSVVEFVKSKYKKSEEK